MCFDLNRFVNKELAENYVCSICQDVLCFPQEGQTLPLSKQEPINSHKYCEVCIKNWLRREKSCPDCREKLEISQLHDLDIYDSVILKELKVYCKYANKGCKFVGKLESIEQHELNECLYVFTECNVCGALVPSLAKHSDKDCINQLTKIINIKNNEIQQRDARINMLLDKLQEYPRVIELFKTEKYLGFKLRGDKHSPKYISRLHNVLNLMESITHGGIAFRHGGLRCGDILLSVNDINVDDKDHDSTVKLIHQATGLVKLVVLYSPNVLIKETVYI